MKLCTSCNIQKGFEGFYKKTRAEDYANTSAGYSHKCKECTKESTAKYRGIKRAKNPDWQREIDLKHSYGISLSDWNELFQKQNGCCAICGDHQSTLSKKLRVDHCHKTGPVRGLLCATCNSGIGMLKDDVKVLEKAISYLNKFNTESAEKSDVADEFQSKKVGYLYS